MVIRQLGETLAGGIARQQLLARLESGHKASARWGSQGLSYVGTQGQLKGERRQKAARAAAVRRLYEPETPFESSPLRVWPN